MAPNPKSFKISTLGGSEGILPKVTKWIPTGCLPLDVALCGGWPVGRITELYGGEASGKSALGAILVANAQKLGYPCFYADSETVVDDEFFEDLGVDVNSLFYEQPETLSEAFTGNEKAWKEAVKEAKDNGEECTVPRKYGINNFIEWKNAKYGKEMPCAIVWDSVASTTTAAELARNDEEKAYSDMAIHLSKILRRDRYLWSESNATLLFINQIRTNVGVTFGEKTTTYGGKAVAFYATARVQLSTVSKIRETRGKAKVVMGEVIKAAVKKLKVGPAYRFCEFAFHFGHGIDDADAIYRALAMFELADKKGKSKTMELTLFGEKEKVLKTEFEEFVQDEDNRDDIYDALDEAFAI